MFRSANTERRGVAGVIHQNLAAVLKRDVASHRKQRLRAPSSARQRGLKPRKARGRSVKAVLRSSAAQTSLRAGEPAADAALVSAMAQGDPAAIAELYDRHAPVMLALARRILGAQADAEDLVHDVFLEAWRHAPEYDKSRGSVKAWLVLRTRSRAVDLRRSAARTMVDYDSRELSRAFVGAEDASLSPDRKRIHLLLSRLPEEQALVLMLGYFEGLSSTEIADRISAPVGTVKSRIASALARLRATLNITREEE
jgi:RNA polymerase sigma-70 factor, ECF subfamily